MYGMSRRDRRRLRAAAVSVARIVVDRGIVLEAGDGGVAKVDDPAAQTILRQAIVRSLRRGGEPVVKRLSETQAARFPHIQGESGLSPWLGVAPASDGRIAVITRGLAVGGTLDPVVAERAARDQLGVELMALALAQDIPGLLSVAGSA